MPLQTGRCLGPYEILALLGAGGMGEVYSACDTRLERTGMTRPARGLREGSEADLKQATRVGRLGRDAAHQAQGL